MAKKKETKKITKTIIGADGVERNEMYRAVHYNMDDIIAELNEIDPTNYAEILQWLCRQTHDKVAYIAHLSRINLFIKCVANSLLNDIRNNSTKCLEAIMPYMAKKQPIAEEIFVADNSPKLTIQVSNELVENNINKLIGNNDANNPNI